MWQWRLRRNCYPQRAATRFVVWKGSWQRRALGNFSWALVECFFFLVWKLHSAWGLTTDFTWTTVQHTDTGCDQLCCLRGCINQQCLCVLLHEISLGAPLNAWWWPRNKNRKPSPLKISLGGCQCLVVTHKNKTLPHISDQEVSNSWCPITKINIDRRLQLPKTMQYIKHPCLHQSNRVLTAEALEIWNRKKISATKSYTSTFKPG